MDLFIIIYLFSLFCKTSAISSVVSSSATIIIKYKKVQNLFDLFSWTASMYRCVFLHKTLSYRGLLVFFFIQYVSYLEQCQTVHRCFLQYQSADYEILDTDIPDFRISFNGFAIFKRVQALNEAQTLLSKLSFCQRPTHPNLKLYNK